MPNFGFNYFAQPMIQQNCAQYYYPNSIFNQGKIKGEILFQNAMRGLPQTPPEPAMCARYVKNAIVNSGLGRYELGNGEQTKYMLRNNLNFREVKVRGEDLQYLPKGTVITYDANTPYIGADGQTYRIGEYGHTVIKGDGNFALSDRPENSIIASDNAHVFMLV